MMKYTKDMKQVATNLQFYIKDLQDLVSKQIDLEIQTGLDSDDLRLRCLNNIYTQCDWFTAGTTGMLANIEIADTHENKDRVMQEQSK